MSRRSLLAASAGAIFVACSRGGGGPRSTPPLERAAEVTRIATTATATGVAPTPTATPTPPAKGVFERVLLPGTPSETGMVIRHSGVRGPVAMVLGGVHGNEPGGWFAGDEVAAWEPAAGSLIVIPRANVQAIARYLRTTDEIGDLNRLYPGNAESPLLMERMAAEILGTCGEFGVSLLLDMHESWAFYAEYQPGSGALGQTITAGVGPLQSTLAQEMAQRVNPSLTEREQMIVRDGTRFSRPGATPAAGQSGRGRSSLSAGVHVAGVTPILVEMGHENSPQDRRVEMHLMTARAALEIVGVL